MKCEEVWRQISNYIDGDVDATLRSGMEEHFRACARCASVLAGARNVVQLYGDELMLEVPAGFSQRLERRLEDKFEREMQEAKKSPVWISEAAGSRWSSWAAWMMPVAAVVLFTAALALVDTLTFHSPAKSILAEPGHNIPPDMLVVISDGSKVFHVAGCPYIHDKATERTITAKQAIHDGYVPCSRCMRQYLKTSFVGRHDSEDANADAGEEAEEALDWAGR